MCSLLEGSSERVIVGFAIRVSLVATTGSGSCPGAASERVGQDRMTTDAFIPKHAPCTSSPSTRFALDTSRYVGPQQPEYALL